MLVLCDWFISLSIIMSNLIISQFMFREFIARTKLILALDPQCTPVRSPRSLFVPGLWLTTALAERALWRLIVGEVNAQRAFTDAWGGPAPCLPACAGL